MYTLICTSYTETEQGLVLRENWTEDCGLSKIYELQEKWQLTSTEENHISKFLNSHLFKVSELLTGRMGLDNVVVHCRIVLPQ